MSFDRLSRILWAATLLTLPVTSFRYFPAGDATYVRPLSFYPLALLLLVLILQLARGKTAFPRAGAWTPFVGLAMATLAASAAGLLIAPAPMRGQDVLGRELRAWVTLGMGVGFFAGAAWMNRSLDDLRFSLKWLFAGFLLDILWSGVQGATFYLHLLPKPLVTEWQRAFSVRELIRTNRISGMAYEPSWLAGEISTLYLPWLFAWLLTRQQATRFRWLEPALLACAALLLLATFSRWRAADGCGDNGPDAAAGGAAATERCVEVVRLRLQERRRAHLATGRHRVGRDRRRRGAALPLAEGIHRAFVEHARRQRRGFPHPKLRRVVGCLPGGRIPCV